MAGKLDARERVNARETSGVIGGQTVAAAVSTFGASTKRSWRASPSAARRRGSKRRALALTTAAPRRQAL